MFNQNGQNANKMSKTIISFHFPSNSPHVRETLESIYDQSAVFGDVLLKVGADLREFKCHRSILSFSSDFLAKLLLQSPKDPVLILPDFEPEVFEFVLLYIYTGELNVSPAKINGFIEACTILEIKGIVDQQYKLLDLIETSTKTNEDYTIVQASTTEELGLFDENDVTLSEGGESIMEEEYVLEEDSRNEDLEEISAQKIEIPSPDPPLKKARLKEKLKPKNILHVEKVNFGFNEIEGSIGSWKTARLLTDGTANINVANAQYFKERLEICTAKIYENVMVDDETCREKYKVRMFFCADPVRLKALVECLICQKNIQVSYKHKNGKFKQWINSNVLRHVETLHKSQTNRSGKRQQPP